MGGQLNSVHPGLIGRDDPGLGDRIKANSAALDDKAAEVASEGGE